MRQYGHISGGKRAAVRLKRTWQLYVLLLPAFIFFVVFHYFPYAGLQIAFKTLRPGAGLFAGEWVGLDQFERFLSSGMFWNAFFNTIRISFANIIIGFPVPVVLALLLNEMTSRRYKKTIQTVTYAPYFISVVVVVSMMKLFLSPSIGVVNNLIEALGGTKVDFLARPDWFLPIFVISRIWQISGWGSIIYMATLSTVDPAQYEAATIDGASKLQRIWHINIPALLPTIVVLLILDCGNILNVGFEKTFLMQNTMNLRASEVLSTYVYKTGIIHSDYSLATAAGLFNSVVNFTVLVAVNAAAKAINRTSLW